MLITNFRGINFLLSFSLVLDIVFKSGIYAMYRIANGNKTALQGNLAYYK